VYELQIPAPLRAGLLQAGQQGIIFRGRPKGAKHRDGGVCARGLLDDHVAFFSDRAADEALLLQTTNRLRNGRLGGVEFLLQLGHGGELGTGRGERQPFDKLPINLGVSGLFLRGGHCAVLA
jgi:hypothetical protein